MKDWSEYQNKTYNNDVCELLIHFLNHFKIESAIDLGCGSGNEAVYLVRNGVKVTAIDRQLNRDYILGRLNDGEKESIFLSEQAFESLQLESADAVTAFFSIPFCHPVFFDELWNKIYNAINDNGYFVGHLFGDRDDWKDHELINTFSLEQVKELLKEYKILKLDEIEHTRELDHKKWHFFEIIAKKIVE